MICQSYKDLISDLAEQLPMADSVRDLPELSHEQLATVLRQYPSAFYDALADVDPDAATLIAERLAAQHEHFTKAYEHVGLCIVGVIRAYVKELVLRDVRAKVERNREADAIEAGHNLQPALTYDQFMAGEFGLGRLV